MNVQKLIEKILSGRADANFDFDDLCRVLISLGFVERIKGSHHIFVKVGVEEIINIQSRRSQAKPYQVKQVRNVILRHRLGASYE